MVKNSDTYYIIYFSVSQPSWELGKNNESLATKEEKKQDVQVWMGSHIKGINAKQLCLEF